MLAEHYNDAMVQLACNTSAPCGVHGCMWMSVMYHGIGLSRERHIWSTGESQDCEETQWSQQTCSRRDVLSAHTVHHNGKAIPSQGQARSVSCLKEIDSYSIHYQSIFVTDVSSRPTTAKKNTVWSFLTRFSNRVQPKKLLAGWYWTRIHKSTINNYTAPEQHNKIGHAHVNKIRDSEQDRISLGLLFIHER